MNFIAVVLICSLGTAPDDCTRETALDVVTRPVPTPFACMMAGQSVVAREQLLADGRFTKVACERRKPA